MNARERTLGAIVIAGSLLAALLVAEVALRLIAPRAQPYAIWPPHMQRVLRPIAGMLPGIAGEAHFVTDSTGVRAEELQPSHAQRLLAIGGSTTECLYLDSSEAWPALVQRALAGPAATAWVGNAGMSGRSAAHHLTALRLLPLEARGITTVLMLVGANDLGRRLKLDTAFAPLGEDELVRTTFTGAQRPFTSESDRGLRRSEIWRLVRRLRQPAPPAAQDADASMYVAWRRNRRTTPELRDTLPDLAPALAEYGDLLASSIDVAREKHVRLILMTQPTFWRADLAPREDSLLWMGGVGEFQDRAGQPYYSARALAAGMAAYNDVLLRVCRERGAECIDLASALPRDTTVFYDDMHFNEEGARKVAAVIVNHLAARPVATRP